eukprot:589779-Amorphochlora_amoeboformis.AAC.2
MLGLCTFGKLESGAFFSLAHVEVQLDVTNDTASAYISREHQSGLVYPAKSDTSNRDCREGLVWGIGPRTDVDGLCHDDDSLGVFPRLFNQSFNSKLRACRGGSSGSIFRAEK